MSCPEIAIHKKYPYERTEEPRYVKRTQKDYSMSFKLQVVQEIERGQLTTTGATKRYNIQCRKTVINLLRKFGNFNWENQTQSNISKLPEQIIIELEVQVKLLEKQKALIEREPYVVDKKAIIFVCQFDIAEKEYQIDIQKNLPPEQSTILSKSNKKQ